MEDLAKLRSRLLMKRNKVGAESPVGRHLSNLIEQIRNYQMETDQDARARLEKFMAASVAAVEDMSR